MTMKPLNSTSSGMWNSVCWTGSKTRTPCLPADWRGFTANRLFRGCRIEIEVRRGDAEALLLDGVPHEGNQVPAALLANRQTLRLTRLIGWKLTS